MSGLDDLVLGADRRLVVCVGPGGVGKTTVAAALGLHAARSGRRTLVLTIDPARRLATMLGLQGVLSDRERRVAWEDVPLAPLAGQSGAPLYAAMLDTGASYDSLIDRIAEDEDHRRRIQGNRMYQVMSRTFGTSHAYVAMERLHDALTRGDYDLVVLDTPPTRNALDILDAPGRLATFLDEDVVRWFVRRPVEGSVRGRLYARGGAAAGRLLGLLVGDALVQELGEFFEVFLSLREGFRERAAAVQRALRADDSAFVLVSSAQPVNLVDAAYLQGGLQERGVTVAGVVFNRAYTPLAEDPREVVVQPGEPAAGARLEALAGTRMNEVDRDALAAALGALDRLRAEAAADNAAAEAAIDAFTRGLDPRCVRARSPRFARDLQELGALARLGELLFTAPSA